MSQCVAICKCCRAVESTELEHVVIWTGIAEQCGLRRLHLKCVCQLAQTLAVDSAGRVADSDHLVHAVKATHQLKASTRVGM